MEKFMIIAGPCAVESEEQILKTAEFLKKHNIMYLRGGAFKPRTSPDSFQGLGKKGLDILLKAKEKYNLKIVSELMDTRDIPLFKDIDIIQIGARNMQNFPLLIEAGKTQKTILLKRGLSATIEEWINAAKYIQKQGNNNIIMCARGIRTFETAARNTPDIDAIPMIEQKTSFKIIFDPSHATGKKELIIPMAKAAIAAGADGLMIEVHPNPKKALSDSEQQFDFKEFQEFLKEINLSIKN
jgi:3-deoxy-7-phosphoheptulonate synthase